MKISTALQIGGLFPILLGILVSLSLLSLFLRSQHVERAERLVQATSVLTQKAACLHIATYHSILNRSPETTGRWQEEIEELAAAAKSVPAGCAVERIMVDRVLENIKLLRQTYNEFAMAAPNAAAYGSPLTIQLLAAFDRVMRNALELGESAESQLRESWGSVDLYFAMFIGIAGLALAGATLSISRDVIARIQSLREWTQRVAAGDFEAKPSVRRSGDELAALENDVAAMIHHLLSSSSQCNTGCWMRDCISSDVFRQNFTTGWKRQDARRVLRTQSDLKYQPLSTRKIQARTQLLNNKDIIKSCRFRSS